MIQHCPELAVCSLPQQLLMIWLSIGCSPPCLSVVVWLDSRLAIAPTAFFFAILFDVASVPASSLASICLNVVHAEFAELSCFVHSHSRWHSCLQLSSIWHRWPQLFLTRTYLFHAVSHAGFPQKSCFVIVRSYLKLVTSVFSSHRVSSSMTI